MRTRILLFPLFATLLFAGCKQNAQVQPQTQVEQTDTAQEAKKMAAALQAGGSVHCTMTKAGSNEKIETWIKDKKMRMHSTGVQGQASDGNMINDGTTLYIWEEGKAEGVKFTLTAETQEQAKQFAQDIPDLSDEATRKQYEDQGYTLSCNQEAIAETEFVAPTAVTFTDTSAQINDAMKTAQQEINKMSPEQKEQMEKMMQQMQGQ